MRTVAAIVIAVAAALLGGCGDGGADDASPERTTTSAATELTTTTRRSSSTTTVTNATSTTSDHDETSGAEDTTSSREATATSSTPEAPPPLRISDGPGSATNLVATSTCTSAPQQPLTTFRWTPSGAGSQRIDVTTNADGFTTGDYLTIVNGLEPRAAEHLWHGPANESTNHWRVITDLESGEGAASVVATFPGPGCVGADMQG